MSQTPRPAFRRISLAGGMVAVAVAVLAISLLVSGPTPASAANVGVAPPLVEHCNDSGATAGMELRCTIAVVNYLNADGTMAAAPASTVTVTVCEGAASGGAVPCAAPVTTVLASPVTTARQCNFAYQGGGSWIECTVTIANHWAADPTPTAATIWQCVGSPITGPGAPGTCTPPAALNTAVSEALANVAQCNRSDYGGGTPVGGFICTVNASTTTALLPMRVDQCNDTGYGGGTVVRCTTTITNDVIGAPPPVPAPGVVKLIVPALPAKVTIVASPPAVVPPTAIVLPPVVIPPGVTEVVLPPVVIPPGVVEVIVPVIPPPGVVVVLTPLPAATGNAGLAEGRGTPAAAWLLGLAAAGLAAAAYALSRRRRTRA